MKMMFRNIKFKITIFSKTDRFVMAFNYAIKNYLIKIYHFIHYSVGTDLYNYF